MTNPIHGPFHPRRPDTILSKMVRGMVPKRKPDGIGAFKRLRVYMGVPEDMRGANMKSFDDSKITKPESYYIYWRSCQADRVEGRMINKIELLPRTTQD